MPNFAYQAADITGRDISGTVEAADRAAAIRQLTGRGLQPFKVAETASAGLAAKAAKKQARADEAAEGETGPLKLSNSQVQLFTEELAELLEAGMRLEAALRLMEGKNAKTTQSRVARKLGNLIREGHPFSSALRQTSPSFNELFCAVAAAGVEPHEVDGRHAVMLRILHDRRLTLVRRDAAAPAACRARGPASAAGDRGCRSRASRR